MKAGVRVDVCASMHFMACAYMHVYILYKHELCVCMARYNKADWYNCIFVSIAHDKRQVGSISAMMI